MKFQLVVSTVEHGCLVTPEIYGSDSNMSPIFDTASLVVGSNRQPAGLWMAWQAALNLHIGVISFMANFDAGSVPSLQQ